MNPQGTYTFVRGSDRLFELIHLIVMVNASIVRAILVTRGRAPDFIAGAPLWTDRDYTRIEAARFPCELRLPNTGIIEGVLDGKEATTISITFAQIQSLPRPDVTAGIRGAMPRVLIALFTEFFEDGKQCIQDHHSAEVSKWPSAWRFARIVRNAFAHGGKIQINNQAAPVESWHGLALAAKDNGRDILGKDFGLVDLIVLLMELSVDLDNLGCPQP